MSVTYTRNRNFSNAALCIEEPSAQKVYRSMVWCDMWTRRKGKVKVHTQMPIHVLRAPVYDEKYLNMIQTSTVSLLWLYYIFHDGGLVLLHEVHVSNAVLRYVAILLQ